LAARQQQALCLEPRTVCHSNVEGVQAHEKNARTALRCMTERPACATFWCGPERGVDCVQNSHLDPDPERRSPQTKSPRFQLAPAPPSRLRGRSVGWRAAWGLVAAASRGNPSL